MLCDRFGFGAKRHGVTDGPDFPLGLCARGREANRAHVLRAGKAAGNAEEKASGRGGFGKRPLEGGKLFADGADTALRLAPPVARSEIVG